MPKQMQRCVNCSKAFYASESASHICEKSDTKNISEAFNQNAIEEFLNFDFYSKIKEIWKENGFKSHEKANVPINKEEIKKEDDSKKVEFSFSPYDNFF